MRPPRAPALHQRATRRLVLVSRLAETWFRRPPTPNRVVLDLTRRCNLRCQMCHTWQRTGEGQLTAEEIGAVLRRMHRLTWLDLTGGEPFVRPDLADVLDAIAESTPALGVLHYQTNGWLTERVVALTGAARRRRPEVDLIVTVSIDGPEAVHDRIRGRPGSFRRAIATAAALMEVPGVEVHIGSTVMPDNAGQLDALEHELLRRLPRFDARRWHLNWPTVSPHFFANGHVKDWPETPSEKILSHQLRARGLPRSMVEAMELLYLINLVFVRRGEGSNIPCQALRSTIFIAPEGDVYPCHIYDRPLGNVRERDILEIWDSLIVRQARADIERLACGGCFAACEAYPALAGAPTATLRQTADRALRLWRESTRRA